MVQTLATLYGWTPDQIGELTPAQICGLLGHQGQSIVTFNTVREAMSYLAVMKQTNG